VAPVICSEKPAVTPCASRYSSSLCRGAQAPALGVDPPQASDAISALQCVVLLRQVLQIIDNDERGGSMKRIYLNVQKQFCAECSLALRRFIGGMDGVQSITVQNGMIEIDYDSSKIAEETLRRISKDSIEKLGYTLSDE